MSREKIIDVMAEGLIFFENGATAAEGALTALEAAGYEIKPKPEEGCVWLQVLKGHHILDDESWAEFTRLAEWERDIRDGKRAIVPVEPTEEMLEAAEAVYFHTYTGTPTATPGSVYAAMLTASQKEE